ncbi:esterase GA18864 isoform X2 [Schistocerca cancellata]|uniref:esterase GA18864 isoform X2 n=1 Tax=Schistocerca cancellata TaxID=274614 RepID=UPI002117B7AB|nr:esterase GA18864 isoform X2 [Schistocerca cancellata]
MTEESATTHSPKKKQKMSQENTNKWKILCIHGYRQNGDVFKQKTGALRKVLKKHAEFVFVTAPMRVPPLETSEPQTTDESSNLGLSFSFKFAILIAGFRSLCSPHYKNYLKTVKIPTLHVYGETDQIIPKEMSEELTSYYLNPIKMVHSGGHYVPASGKDVYIKFLEEGIWEVMEEEECEENESVSGCNDESEDSET